MAAASEGSYLAGVVEALRAQWPGNRSVRIVCHGHSVPAGYTFTPVVDTFGAYPHLLHRGLKQRFPFAVVNVIVTAVGGEHSEAGAERFEREVLSHRPDVLTIDYGLNDPRVGLERAGAAWERMIAAALEREVKVLLLTPTASLALLPEGPAAERESLQAHAGLIRELAGRRGVGLVDSLAAFVRRSRSRPLSELMSWYNHPNRRGHALVARELLRWFPVKCGRSGAEAGSPGGA